MEKKRSAVYDVFRKSGFDIIFPEKDLLLYALLDCIGSYYWGQFACDWLLGSEDVYLEVREILTNAVNESRFTQQISHKLRKIEKKWGGVKNGSKRINHKNFE